MSTALAALLGGAAGAVALLVLVVILARIYWQRNRNISRASESNSSDPSIQAGENVELALREGLSCPSDSSTARSFNLEELNLATKNFNDANLIGHGKFGDVYKGLLPDMIVAIKKRQASASQEFVTEVQYLSSIHHRNLVSLLGYCQENNLQMLVFEYIPNGSIASHLYGANQTSSQKLEFKHRLSIASGSAKALTYLHSLNPPREHKDFKTSNVLVDENFTPKVADVGLRNLLDNIDGAGSSSQSINDLFMDPESKEFGRFSEKSDVYSFGVFLLELVSGKEASWFLSSGSRRSIVEWAQGYDPKDISSYVDQRMGSSFTPDGMREFFQLAVWCLHQFQARRPPMSFVVSELDRIQEKEMSLTTLMGGRTPTVTLGSQLFTGPSSN